MKKNKGMMVIDEKRDEYLEYIWNEIDKLCEGLTYMEILYLLEDFKDYIKGERQHAD